MRSALRPIAALLLAALLPSLAQPIYAQTREAIAQKLRELPIKATKLTADKSDVVTAGSVLVLHKDGLVMCSTTAVTPITNTYKNGKLSVGFGDQLVFANIAQRKFVAGEKFWTTGAKVGSDGAVLVFYSDPYDGVRYYGQLKIPYSKGAIPPADEVVRAINEVVTAEPMDDASQPAPAPDADQPQQALEPVAPPPPPPDQPPAPPKTVAIGQTRDEVVAIFGQPQKVAQLSTKEIDYYPDMKVIFVKGKVADIQ
jgi:hypothetical protein